MTPSHVCTKCNPPAKCHRPNCPSYLFTQEIEQIDPSCNKKRPEKGDIPKSSLLVHIPSALQKTHVVQNGQNDVGSKQLGNSQRASLKIRDCYEERESLVEQIYTNVPRSREKTQANHSRLSYARKIDGLMKTTIADIFRKLSFSKTPFWRIILFVQEYVNRTLLLEVESEKTANFPL